MVNALLLSMAAGGLLRLISPAGLDFVHRNSPTSQKYVIETMAGGVAVLDYDNDSRLDLFFVNGGKLDDPVKLPARYARSPTRILEPPVSSEPRRQFHGCDTKSWIVAGRRTELRNGCCHGRLRQ